MSENPAVYTAQRVIKFRAWNPLTGFNRWESPERVVVRADGAGVLLTEPDPFFGGSAVPRICGESRILVIEQFTGLKDKNGREIYEGDVVEWPRFDYSHDGTQSIFTPTKNGRDTVRFSDGSFLPLNIRDREIVVIGNIHENPELVK